MQPAIDECISIDFPEGEEMLLRVSELFAANGGKKSIEHLRWQYVKNPGGGSYCAFARVAGNEDAAAYSLFKVRAKVDGRVMVVCQSLDTLTGARHRGKGLFRMLANAVNSRCDSDGIAFIYGFPNDKSGPGFFRHLNWESRGFPPFLIFINNLGYFGAVLGWGKINLPSILPGLFVKIANRRRVSSGGYSIRHGSDFLLDGQYDEVWNSFSSDIPSLIVRDARYLKWRYVDRPNSDYEFVAIYRGERLLAIAIYVLRQKHGGLIGYVMDVIYAADEHAAGKLAVGSAIEAMISQKVDLVLSWASTASKTRSIYSGNFFVPLPRKLQPIKLFVGVRLGPGVEMMSSMFISYADSDTV